MFPEEKYFNDLECLMTLRNFVWKEIQEDLPDDFTFEHHVLNGCLVDGRMMRRVYPRGAQELQKAISRDTLHFVGFFGESLPHPDVVRKQIWSLDDTLVKDLQKHEMIIAYASMEVTRGGNWCNLVVVTSPEALQHWQCSENHGQAVAMSPVFYKSIRIHFGEMRGGISNTEFIPYRTTFLEFQNKRSVQSWK